MIDKIYRSSESIRPKSGGDGGLVEEGHTGFYDVAIRLSAYPLCSGV